MTQPCAEIERRVAEKYQPAHDRIWEEYERKQKRLFSRLRSTRKPEGCVASLMEWTLEVIQDLILVRADAYTEALSELPIPAAFEAEQSFSKFSRDCAEACVGQVRTCFRTLPPKVADLLAEPGIGFDQEAQRVMGAAKTEGLRRLHKQKLRRTPAQVTAHVDDTDISNAVRAECFSSAGERSGAPAEAEGAAGLDAKVPASMPVTVGPWSVRRSPEEPIDIGRPKRPGDYHAQEALGQRFYDLSAANGGNLAATWTKTSLGIEWLLVGDEYTQNRFLVLATEAAEKCVPYDASSDARLPCLRWLDEVKRATVESDLVTMQPLSRCIRDICRASAMLCANLQVVTQQAEAGSDSRRQDSSGDPLEQKEGGAVPVSTPATVSSQNVRRSPKELVDAARRKGRTRSYAAFAAQLAISRDTLYKITAENRWVADETYIMVATACNCQPEELHPRDIPRPRPRGTAPR